MENDEWEYWGLDIYSAVNNMVNVFNENGEKIENLFNGVTVVVDEDNNVPNDVVNNYFIELRKNEEERRNSKEYIEANLAKEEKVKEWQDDADKLMVELEGLDFSNEVEVLDWIASIQGHTDDRRVNVDVTKIIDVFMKVGIRPIAGIDDDKKREEMYNIKGKHAMMIISQSLDMLIKVGSIHHMVVTWVKTWKNMFGENNE